METASKKLIFLFGIKRAFFPCVLLQERKKNRVEQKRRVHKLFFKKSFQILGATGLGIGFWLRGVQP